MKIEKCKLKRVALALSLGLLILWGILGTGTSLAWFSDTSTEIKNIINMADFELVVSHRLENGDYDEIDGKTDIFDREALYEPGYVQVVYLKIENRGSVPFNYKAAVGVHSFRPAINVFGQSFTLQEYLKFGVVTADSEQELDKKLETRELARSFATKPLNNYDTHALLDAGGTEYMALVVYMPKDVQNSANYRGETVPEVELGIIVTAEQLKTE